MFEFPDRTRNISANAASGDIALNLTPPDEPDTTITIKALPEIGEILVPGGTALLPGQDITASDLTQLVYRPATDGAGDDFFSLVTTEAGGRRTDIAIDVTTTGRVTGNGLYFEAQTDAFGSELWRLLPTGQVEMVADIYDNTNDGQPRYMTPLGDTLYFRAESRFDERFGTGYEPWRVGPDGSAEALDEINPGRTSANPTDFTEFMGTLWFSANHADTGQELYRIGADGNAELVADINPGAAHSRPVNFTPFDGALYFSADTEANGIELWRVTEAGEVELVRDIYAGDGNSNPSGFTELGGNLYFAATGGGEDGHQIWRVDGEGNAAQVTDADSLLPNAKPRALRAFADQLWFQADDRGLGNNYNLYRMAVDGAPVLVEDFRVGGLLSEIRDYRVFGDALYFSIGESVGGEARGHELWRAFADDRVEMVADINPGAPPSNPREFTLFNGAMYFTATDADHGQELWRVDAGGIAAMVRDLNPGDGAGATHLYVHDGALYFAGDDGETGWELWRMAPDESFAMVADINDGPRYSLPTEFVAMAIDAFTGMPDGSTRDDILFGSDEADSANGYAGDDVMRGLGGDDELTGGSGDDDIDGGAGEDTAIFDVASTDVTATLDGGIFTIESELGTDSVTGIEQFRFSERTLTLAEMTALAGGSGEEKIGTPGDDLLEGGDGADLLRGLDGADRLIGLGGDDTLEGGDGADTINGGDGDDLIRGGETEDDRRDVVYAGAGDDSVDGGHGNDQIYGQDGNDTLAGGFGADTVEGQNGDDVITGSAFGDIVFGNAGNDFVNGGFGHDLINGGTGADKFFHVGGTRDQMLGHGSDWVQDYDSAEGDVLVFGGSATADQFQVNTTHTANRETGERSGDDDIEEAFVIYRPTGQILWALVDGGGQDSINLQIGAEVFDILG